MPRLKKTSAKKPAKKKAKSKLTALEQQIADLNAILPAQQDWRATDEQEELSIEETTVLCEYLR